MGAVYYVNQKESVSGIKKGHPGEWSSAGVRLVVHILAAVTFLHQSCDHSDLFHLSTIPSNLGNFCRESPPGRDSVCVININAYSTLTCYCCAFPDGGEVLKSAGRFFCCHHLFLVSVFSFLISATRIGKHMNI